MRTRSSIGSLLLVVAMMPVAHAGPSFDRFKQICVTNHADSTTALAASDGAGWMPMPQSLFDKLSSNAMFSSIQGRIRSDSSGMQMLVTGTGRFPFAPDIGFHICSVASVAKPPEAMEGDTAAFAGVPNYQGMSNGTMWVWREQDGKHLPIDYSMTTAENKAMIARGGVQILVLFKNPGMSMVMLAVPASESPSPVK